MAPLFLKVFKKESSPEAEGKGEKAELLEPQSSTRSG